jgi:hypothetical protein
MADDSETLKVRMLRVSGKNETIQWFEYRPAFNVDIVRIEWEIDTMDVELDRSVADYLLRAGYAADIPQGSAPATAPSNPPAAPAPDKKALPSDKKVTEEMPPPPAAPSWLKPNGG